MTRLAKVDLPAPFGPTGASAAGEEGIEDVLEVLLGDAGPRVLDDEAHAVRGGVRLEGDAELAAPAHRTARVEEEVEHDLLEAAAVALDRPAAVGAREPHVHAAQAGDARELERLVREATDAVTARLA